jgi:3-hydroxyisobutyrate dehydrogenase-like beta-hydroxyacid dehydrogenase
MATNLIRAGFPLTLHNRSRGRELLVLEGLQAMAVEPQRAACAAEAVANADIVCLCLSDDAAVQEVLLGCSSATATTAALPHLRPGAVVIDFSTIAPATSRTLAARLAEQQVAYIDAPVTGGTEGAKAGTLSVLVGGAPEHLERARPVLEVVGGRITHIGPVGSGQEAKAVNQVLVAGSYAAVAEAVALGQRLGLPMERVLAALKSGAAGSWALEHRSTNMLTGTFPLGFKLALHHKDLAIALEAAAAAGVGLPITERVAAIERELMEAGFGQEDVSALARYYLKG